ncbi:DivIVA domain-containing protein [Plantactinospora sp. GCM10030261]|uniref:DivIVA domain-containing protein n=1 Tax=Plantactinospora sp. GCM10030261 TaxID=3273420 RepID=UPI003605D6B5
MAESFTVALRGYDMKQVDALLAQADEALAGDSGVARAAARHALQTTTFTVRLRGYARAEVTEAVTRRMRSLG